MVCASVALSTKKHRAAHRIAISLIKVNVARLPAAWEGAGMDYPLVKESFGNFQRHQIAQDHHQ